MTETSTINSIRINQGDIYRNVEYFESIDILNNEIKISKITFPLVVVLTQDCDLEHDSKYRIVGENQPLTDNRKLLSVIVVPLYNEEMFLAGEHLNDNRTIKMKMRPFQKFNKKKSFTSEYSNLINNETPRYHHLSFAENAPNIVDSVIDFKHYFTANIDCLMKSKNEKFVCSISPLHREKLSQRFAYFLSRIGLPNK